MRLPAYKIFQSPADPEFALSPEALDARWRSLPLKPHVSRVEFQIANADIPPVFEWVTFKALEDRWSSLPQPAFMLCRRMAKEGVVLGKPGILLTGCPGSGKTSLAIATLKATAEAIRGRRPVHFWKVAAGLNRIRSRFGRPADEATNGEEQAQESVLDLVPNYLVVLDDLGQERLTEWAHDQLYTLLDALLEHRRRIIITSNSQPEKWNVNEALRSRILGMCHPIEAGNKDWRVA